MNIIPNHNKRRNGKVALLPQPIRDQINRLLDDGVTYAAIIKKLAPLGVSLNVQNLSNWFHGGFQDYLHDLFWREQLARLQENYTKLFPDARLAETSLQWAATSLCLRFRQLHQLRDQDHPQSHNTPDDLLPLINTLCRVSRETLKVQKHRQAQNQHVHNLTLH